MKRKLLIEILNKFIMNGKIEFLLTLEIEDLIKINSAQNEEEANNILTTILNDINKKETEDKKLCMSIDSKDIEAIFYSNI